MYVGVNRLAKSGLLKALVLALPLCDRIQSNFDVRVHSLI